METEREPETRPQKEGGNELGVRRRACVRGKRILCGIRRKNRGFSFVLTGVVLVVEIYNVGRDEELEGGKLCRTGGMDGLPCLALAANYGLLVAEGVAVVSLKFEGVPIWCSDGV